MPFIIGLITGACLSFIAMNFYCEHELANWRRVWKQASEEQASRAFKFGLAIGKNSEGYVDLSEYRKSKHEGSK